jgi:hypothetical protein
MHYRTAKVTTCASFTLDKSIASIDLHYSKKMALMGVSTVKWAALDPCLVFRESDSNLYTNFKCCEEKNY